MDEGDKQVYWKTLRHSGPLFPKEYERLPKKVKLLYDKHPIPDLDEAEEFAVMFANLLMSKHDDTKDKTFRKNFFTDFVQLLSPSQQRKITDLKKLDFKYIIVHLKIMQKNKALITKEAKAEMKAEARRKRALLQEKHGFCLLNKKKEPLGNWVVEPPGLFRGREGNKGHGHIKKRIKPEDVSINISRNVNCPAPRGHSWKEIVSIPTVTWVAKYQNCLGQIKYIQLSQTSTLKNAADQRKYNLAKLLSSRIFNIRKTYSKLLHSRHDFDVQMGVAVYFIDKFALRVGNEKGAEAADTVGCTTLRVEHVALRSQSSNHVAFDFKGKDSIRFQKVVVVPPPVYAALKRILHGKHQGDQLFDKIKATDVNSYLKELLPHLSAKVFRTCNASTLFESELEMNSPSPGKRKIGEGDEESDQFVRIFHKSTLSVARLCNHKKTLNPEVVMRQQENLNKVIERKKSKIKKLAKEARTANREKRERIEARLAREGRVLEKKEYQKKFKTELADFSLNTSLQNYIDPRITVAWARKYKLPLDKVWRKNFQSKYAWAVKSTPSNFTFR